MEPGEAERDRGRDEDRDARSESVAPRNEVGRDHRRENARKVLGLRERFGSCRVFDAEIVEDQDVQDLEGAERVESGQQAGAI
jgi:hypothetical protein